MICPVCNKPLSFYEPYEFKGNKRVHVECFLQQCTCDNVLNDIKNERERQDKLHPEKLALSMRFVTIMEEAGEVAEAMQDDDLQSVYRELIETAACCVRMAEEVLERDFD